ncbi:unnamed protein product [Prunus armeniaca]|uniref:Uncharacterized protein n=1 Tax=Prunus armeniaca TaxID=36596 RepID=A0A6J5VN14_PRUAR|nr:unnamed protein product [Prunus armeniaca]
MGQPHTLLSKVENCWRFEKGFSTVAILRILDLWQLACMVYHICLPFSVSPKAVSRKPTRAPYLKFAYQCCVSERAGSSSLQEYQNYNTT